MSKSKSSSPKRSAGRVIHAGRQVGQQVEGCALGGSDRRSAGGHCAAHRRKPGSSNTELGVRDTLSASCHTQPESEFYQRSLAAPVDLASAHTAKQVDCIQCHSGPGAAGRLQAVSSVAAPDLVHYLTKNFHDPAIVTVPISNDNCLEVPR